MPSCITMYKYLSNINIFNFIGSVLSFNIHIVNYKYML